MTYAHPRRWTALAVIALAQFMVIADTSIIGVALPDIRSDLGFSPEDLSWVFFINIPVALIALALTPRLMPSVPARSGSVDIVGATLATGGLAALVFAIVRAPEQGWGSTATLAVGAAGLAALALFVVVQAGRREPIMRLGILRSPNLAAANIAQVLLGAAWVPMWFFLNLYLQQVLGLGAFESGAALLPMTVAITLGMVVVAPRLMARIGAKPMVVGGLFILAAGLALLSLVRANGSFVVDVLPASLVAAAGMALAFIPSLQTAISGARPEEGGLASGIVNTSYQVGSALGLAAMTALAAAHGAGQLGNIGALSDGYSAAFLGAAGIAVAGALMAAVTLRRPKAPAAEPASAPEPELIPA